MREWTFHYLLLALNYDTNYPKVLGHGYGPPHNWMGMEVPGCRGLGTAENPDNHYSFIPVGVNSPMEIHGKVQDPAIEDVNFHITSNHSQAHNVCGLTWREIRVADDGTFVITMDREPANGRPNHLQLTPDSKRLFIRDSRKDWNQRPNAYRVRRVDPPTAPPLSVDEQVEMAFRTIIDDVPFNFWFRMMVGYLEPNTVKGPEVTSNFGGHADPAGPSRPGRPRGRRGIRAHARLAGIRLLGVHALRLVADERQLLEPHEQPQQRPGRPPTLTAPTLS